MSTSGDGSPYRGLVPYSEQDSQFFFGRDSERKIVAANLIAYRLTLVYGHSGVGKSSLLQAGVAHDLRERAKRSLEARGNPDGIVVVFRSWKSDPTIALQEEIRAAATSVLGARGDFPEASASGLTESLTKWTEAINAPLLIVLDQFEEYFLYHGSGDPFDAELPRLITAEDLPVNFLISIREDAYAQLDHFEGRIPGLYSNYLRVDHLSLDAGEKAIRQPINRYNEVHGLDHNGFEVEDALVDAVLQQVTIRDVAPGREQGESSETRDGDSARVETPFLQLVMSKLWNAEVDTGSRVLRGETLSALGGAETIVRQHVDDALKGFPKREQDVAAKTFRYLVTPSGTKIAHSVSDLSEYADVPQARLSSVLEKLAGDARIVRPVPSPNERDPTPVYEIFHDVLAQAVLDWSRRYRHRRNVRRRTEALVAGFLVVLGATIAILVSVINDKNDQLRRVNYQFQVLKAIPRDWTLQQADQNTMIFRSHNSPVEEIAIHRLPGPPRDRQGLMSEAKRAAAAARQSPYRQASLSFLPGKPVVEWIYDARDAGSNFRWERRADYFLASGPVSYFAREAATYYVLGRVLGYTGPRFEHVHGVSATVVDKLLQGLKGSG